ncbi:MAG: hypothetical protein GY903_16075 [Fuerstiella sp.]|nr:hypothetical protein [Fuerstiella sp.]MCP4856001.1 hypothetical protein [Fuerstiella sp.]
MKHQASEEKIPEVEGIVAVACGVQHLHLTATAMGVAGYWSSRKAICSDQLRQHSGLVESIDLYPTLCKLSGLKSPDHLQGNSFAGLMKDPQAEWKTTAVGRFQKGDTIRTRGFRFTEYSDAVGTQTAAMLYDHAADPDEDVNVLESRQQIVSELTKQLHRIKANGRN